MHGASLGPQSCLVQLFLAGSVQEREEKEEEKEEGEKKEEEEEEEGLNCTLASQSNVLVLVVRSVLDGAPGACSHDTRS